ncbi:MAG TPA: NADP-dependent oxidoreductase [Actinocrinis sp.]|jgi:NADPH:quinone reductase-like Zn-dependent oxidoreductase
MPKAYVYTAHGGPEVEAFDEVPRPIPGPGQVLVAVRAAGVNPVDWKRRAGFNRPGAPGDVFPVVFGAEAAGVVEQLGPQTEGFAAGDAVFGSAVTGAYAEYAVLSAEFAARKPPSVSFTDAAALTIAGPTAHDGVAQAGLAPGSTLLVTGVGGGVGVAAAQIARRAGLNVIGTAGAQKKEFVEALGVVYVEPGPDVADRIRAAAGGIGGGAVDAIFDLVGGAHLEAVAVLLENRSKLVTAGDRLTAARLGGVPVERDRRRAVLDRIAGWTAQGVFDPLVTATYPLEEAPEALRAVEDGHARGKIVVRVGD